MKISPVLAVLLLVGCAETGRTPEVGAGARDASSFCTDEDGDGYGEGCARGGDCNDVDPAIHQGCLSCVRPAEGCACDNSNKPISCYLQPSTSDEGIEMCHEGTRYCRDGSWSACESVFSYPKPEAAAQPLAIVNPDAGVEKCSECRPNCFVVRDNLNPTLDGGLGDASMQTTVSDGGGLSLDTYIVDAGPKDASTYDAAACMIGAAPDKDCDGILDDYDPYPNDKPFATANPTIFLDIPAGGTGTGAINLSFYLNSADVYFLLDQTGSMGAERDNLVDGLTKGDFVNNAAYNCSDFDFDKKPNNELKAKGIIGAIRCYIREANFGIGYFREIPFDATSTSKYAWMYGLDDEIAFRNLQDITSDVDKVTTNAAKLSTRGNYDWEEAAMPALHSLITGGGMYFGVNKSSIAPRTGCPANTWGYPCFRNDAIPIVVLFTDAPTHNGPTTNTLPYDSKYLDISKNTSGSVVEAAGETFALATDVGDVTSSYVTFSGDSSTMQANSTTAAFTCASQNSAPDAFYKFTLNSKKTVSLTTEGSEFDTVLALWQGMPATATSATTNPSGNDAFSNAYSFGDITNQWIQATGSSSTLKSDYLASDLGCSAYSGSPDVAFKFSVSQKSKIALDTAGSTIGTSVSLFSGTPTLATYSSSSNTNDTIASAQNMGTIDGTMKAYSGTTDIGSITTNYTGSQLGCGAADAARDAVYTFTVGGATTRRVRVTAEDSALDTVLALTDSNGNNLGTTTTSSGNDSEWSSSSTYDLGTLDAKAFRLTGDTSSLGTHYSNSLIGCNATSRDAVYKFTLATERTVRISTDTADNKLDTVVGLFRNSIVSSDTAVSGSDSYENMLSAGYPGALDGKRYVISGSTDDMDADYSSTQLGSCTSSSSNSGDAVYRLHLNAPTSVRLDTAGSSFDTVMALYSALPDQVPVSISTGDTPGAPYAIGDASDRNVVFENSGSGTWSFASDVAINDGSGCYAHDTSPDAVLSLTISKPGDYTFDTGGSNFDTVLGIYEAAKLTQLPTATAASGNDLSGGAVDVGTIDANTWKSYTGTITSGMAGNQTNFSNCGAAWNGKDVYFKFTTSGSSRTMTIDTMGSTMDTVLGVFTSSLAKVGSSVAGSYCNDNGANPGDSFTGTFAANTTYYVVLKGKSSGATGSYKITFRDSQKSITPYRCDDNSGSGSASRVSVANLPAGNYVAVIKGKDATDKGRYKLAIRHDDWVDAGGSVLACNDDAVSGSTASSITAMDLAAGDYYVVIKGKSSWSGEGDYVLSMQDIGGTVANGWLTCNDNNPNGGTTTSFIEQKLSAGSYWVVIKGKSGAWPTSGVYGIDIRDTAAPLANVIDCDYNSGSGGTSAIEQDLAPGAYRVIVKGKAAGDKGAYKLQVRDVTSLPAGTGRLACNYNSGAGGKSYLEQTVDPGTYTVLLKGDSSSATGNYKLSIRDASNVNASEAPMICNDDASYGTRTSKFSKTLDPGTYYVGVKGHKTLDQGRFQLSFGAGSTTTGKYTPPTWSDTLAALTAKKVRVIPILSCKDDPDHGDWQGDCKTARTQFTALANATGALGSNLKPLIYDIDTNGTGLSGTVVQGIASLAQYLEMNVSAQVVFSPDANPGFILSVKAVDAAGDGCNGLIGNEHQKCAPGATPRFEISFTNPADSPVPRNSTAKDPNGGYNFKAQLIANGQFVVDEVPIYIIPENVTSAPPPPKVYASGTYTQGLAADGCAGKTDLPDWSDLTWNATIPNGTSVQFGLCSGANANASSTCTPTPICKISGGATCSATSPCPAGSFCSAAGNCNTITANACTTNANCPSQATCRSNVCTFDGQPIDVGEILATGNGNPNLKVQITLNANTTTNVGPKVSDWQINYLCKSSL